MPRLDGQGAFNGRLKRTVGDGGRESDVRVNVLLAEALVVFTARVHSHCAKRGTRQLRAKDG